MYKLKLLQKKQLLCKTLHQNIYFRKVSTKMSTLKFFKWLGILLPIIQLLFLFDSDYRSNFSGFSGVLLWIVSELLFIFISFCLIYFVVGRKSKCPSCTKPFAMKKTNEELIAQKNVSVLVETKSRNNDGAVTGTSEQYVPGIKTTYRDTFTCRYCGKSIYKTRYENTPLL